MPSLLRLPRQFRQSPLLLRFLGVGTAELQGIGIDAAKLSNLNPDLGDVLTRMTLGFLINAVEDGSGNAEFVHSAYSPQRHGKHGVIVALKALEPRTR